MNTPSTPVGREPLPPLPFTREQLREDVCNILLFEARKAAHLHGMSSIAKPAFLDDFDDSSYFSWNSQEYNASELGITYDKVSHFELALAMEDCFDYGFYAAISARTESLEYENIHTWIGYYLQDSATSRYFEEWESYGAKILDSFKRCLYAYELANARLMLEDKEAICYFRTDAKDEDGNTGELSIHQLSMLAGIEELSLRSAISRKTAPILEIKKDDRRTYIEIDTAKQWLIAKGRYQPELTVRHSAELDLSNTRFDSVEEFLEMLTDRFAFIRDKANDRAAFEQSMTQALLAHKVESLRALWFEELCNDPLIESIATLLDLSVDLLKNRAKEAVLKTRIKECEYALKRLQQLP